MLNVPTGMGISRSPSLPPCRRSMEAAVAVAVAKIVEEERSVISMGVRQGVKGRLGDRKSSQGRTFPSLAPAGVRAGRTQ